MQNRKPCRAALLGSLLLASTPLAAQERLSEVPFRLYQGHLVVAKGSLGPLQGLDFMVDTGTMLTVIDLKVARRLGVLLEVPVHLEGVKDGRAREVTVPELSFGPHRIAPARVLAADLSFMGRAGANIHAIVGLDVLKLRSFTLDYASRRITFGPVEDSPSAVPFQSVSPLLTVDLAIGDSTARIAVDTGAPMLILFPNRMRSRLPGFRLRDATTAYSAGGMSRARDIELTAVSLGPSEWLRVGACLLDVSAPAYELDGLLGPPSLPVKRLRFDFGRNRLSWER